MSKHGFHISHPLIELEIKLVRIDRLRLHEETLPDVVGWLAEKIKMDGCWMHPIIVDNDTLVVLDGMHRVVASKRLDYHLVPVCAVDYDNPHISLGCWYRTIGGMDMEKIPSLLEEAGFTLEPCPRSRVGKLLAERKATAVLVSPARCFAVHGSSSEILGIYDEIWRIEQKLIAGGCFIGYEIEKKALEGSAVLAVPSIRKEEVLQTALSGNIFCPKATRHAIPARPLHINVPLSLLSTDDLEGGNEWLVASLASKRVEHLPGGQMLDRFYDEELYVFRG